MSLRLRLTILYSAITAGILLLFGLLVFLLVSMRMSHQIDQNLADAYDELVKDFQVGPNGTIIEGVMPQPDLASNIIFQVWDQRGRISFYSPSLGMIRKPLDATGFQFQYIHLSRFVCGLGTLTCTDHSFGSRRTPHRKAASRGQYEPGGLYPPGNGQYPHLPGGHIDHHCGDHLMDCYRESTGSH